MEELVYCIHKSCQMVTVVKICFSEKLYSELIKSYLLLIIKVLNIFFNDVKNKEFNDNKSKFLQCLYLLFNIISRLML